MKLKIKKQILVIMIICLVSSLMHPENLMVNAEDASNAELLKQRIEETKETQKRNYIEISDDEREINDDYKKVQKIVTKKGEKKYEDYYGGAYMTEDGKLVIQTVGASTAEKKKILNNTSDHVIIKKVKNSYNDLQNTYEEISEKFQNCVEKQQQSKELEELTDNMVGVSVDQQQNAVVVYLDSVTDEAKTQFAHYYGNSGVIFEEGEEEWEEETLLKLGRAYYDSASGSGSIGMKAYYINSNGEKIKGFVTAAHVVDNVGEAIYIDKARKIKIGKVTKRKYKDNMDVAFIKITNEDYKPSRKVYYADSKGTISDKYVLDTGYLVGTYVGATIYKAGAKTYVTKGKIVSTSKTVKSAKTNMVLTDLWQADYESSKGDSGGAVFDVEVESIAGIHRGSLGTSTKWENIVEAWDLEIY